METSIYIIGYIMGFRMNFRALGLELACPSAWFRVLGYAVNFQGHVLRAACCSEACNGVIADAR